MCTVSVIRLPGELLRVACNRDEQHGRPDALPPSVRDHLTRSALSPTDPTSDGTWIAATDAGIALVLLNVNPLDTPPPGKLSRGGIVPSLAAHGDHASLRDALAHLDLPSYSPFRLLALDRAQVTELVWTGRKSALTTTTLDRPLFATSSGLGDIHVESPRRRLFETVLQANPTAGNQDALHDHAWPEQLPISIRMCRADARTVSRTVVTLAPDHVTMSYQAIPRPPGVPAPAAHSRLTLAAAPA